MSLSLVNLLIIMNDRTGASNVLVLHEDIIIYEKALPQKWKS